ncbi:response regulator [Sphingomonas sp. ABOLD]|uniref:histidine kinase n=1 Tax=Sphingomonas trueperi TaxID=53317 RepID=A0A7X5XWJ8_9SPHN|nr:MULTISPECIES: histidine kinase famiy protein [unclassified Sphingomonas]NJB96310.1 PAS domain S-box-containing protein [Sphingomonas trueperi]RSV42563.1 response regulator [Sphingomonas sp. ABOLE]RSV43419.1 response regulator [Sphingomonas sp. ABOLD]
MQTDDEHKPAATGEAAGDLKDSTSYSPTGNHPTHHWKRAVIDTPGLGDRSTVFFAALQMTRMPMILTDPRQDDNPIVFANKAFLDLTGYEEHEILGRNCRFLQGAETDRDAVAELRAAIDAKEAIALELINYRRDGSSFWNAVFIAPVLGPDGELLYFFASQLDVTRRRESEQSFRQAQKMEAIGQLTAGLAHDFNNLLQVVSGNIDIVASQVEDERHRRLLTNAARAADRGSKLTRQLLAFARKTRLEPKTVDMNQLIHEFGDLLDNTVGAQIRLVTALERRLPAVQVDPTHLEMAILNVLLNARDAMPKGGTVTIGTRLWKLNGDAPMHQLPEGEYVVLTIRDEGTGMPDHVRRRATEPFFTTKGAERGTGLGLAMVHGFVQQSLGRLEIDSAPGEGTEIRMLFPVANATTGTAPAAPAPKQATGQGATGGSETILLVEDSDDVRALAQEQIAALGYRVVLASSGEEALERLRTETIDLLFTDIVMPGGMSGLELVEQFREAHPETPVLMTTGYNEDLVADIPRGSNLDVIGKPYRREQLADRIRAALDRRTSGARRAVNPIVPAEG